MGYGRKGSLIIDVHAHPVLVKEVLERDPELLRYVHEIFNLTTDPQPIETFIREMGISGISKAVLLAIDCETVHGCCLPSNKHVAELVKKNSERFVGFASVDPNKGARAAKELKTAVRDLGLSGLKLNPSLQEFVPNDKSAYPVYEAAQDLKIPVLFHAGMTWRPKNRLKFSDPRLLDDVAIDFPDLKIIIAHFGFPWVWETAVLAMRHPNVYIDLANTYTGTALEHLKLVLTEIIPQRILERFLADKILFGSDYPRIEADKMAIAVKQLPISEEIKRKILWENAAKLLKISEG